MGLERGILRAAVAAELILTAACTPIEPPSPTNTFHIVRETPISKSEAIFSLLARDSNFAAAENNTTFKWEGRFCEGEMSAAHTSVVAVCEGVLIEAEGRGQANKGERLNCPEMQEAERMECYISDTDPSPTILPGILTYN